MHRNCETGVLVATADDEDLDNVAQELKDLKELVGTYGHRAEELQVELRLAQDECRDLLKFHDSSDSPYRDQTEELTKKLQVATEQNSQQQKAMRHLQRKVHLYKEELQATLAKLESEKAWKITHTTEKKKTQNAGVQTVLDSKLADQVNTAMQLMLPSSERVDSGRSFAIDLLDITFGLHEQLSRYQNQNQLQSEEHARFVKDITDLFERKFKLEREKHKVKMREVRNRLQKVTNEQIEILRKEKNDLMHRVNQMNLTQREKQHQINNLQELLSSMRTKLKNAEQEH
ncbi:unnamed protein product [Calicophoron daubneyi]|uniref:Uncharacterized protein n=1 Tax=Calicophoron daubneyi TaxID=300641 RepID=A0AAV2TEF6_CALDB